MARLYISATYDDRVEHRRAVAETLRKMGHVAVCMEDYVASDRRPLSRCLEDVRGSDALILIVGWRSGYVPPGHEKAITQLEYAEAVAREVKVLPFLASPAAPWPEASRDHFKTTTQFREELRERHMVGFFETPTQLALQVAVLLPV